MSGVAIVAERWPPEKGGLARATARVAAMAVARGERAHVIRVSRDAVPGSHTSHEQDGVVVHELGLLDRHEEQLRAWAEQTAEVVASEGLDVVHGMYAVHAGFVAVLAAAFANVGSVVSLRGNDFDRGLFRNTLPQLELAVSRATMVTAVTREMARRAGVVFGRPCRFVPNAVDTTAFKKETPDNTLRASLGLGEGHVIGFSGELREKKGVRFLLPAFAALTRHHDVHLLLIGGIRQDAQEAWEVFQRAEPEAAGRVHVLKYDPDATRMSQRLSLCDVMVFPSLFEGMPNAVLEAMAAERAIVATAVGGHSELIEHEESGALLPLGELSLLPEALAEMLALSPKKRAAMGRAACQYVQEHHSPELESETWGAVYEQVRDGVTR